MIDEVLSKVGAERGVIIRILATDKPGKKQA
jgi:hypothetical protein